MCGGIKWTMCAIELLVKKLPGVYDPMIDGVHFLHVLPHLYSYNTNSTCYNNTMYYYELVTIMYKCCLR